ncbi:hypothetical protein COO60DRAFT_132015 [Scenedesmus sp. NREL 46B-D3]|nr:hypothetical protein COO60DRAFT_132015 [Scenedesmus sp. NREL 46B-D3]
MCTCSNAPEDRSSDTQRIYRTCKALHELFVDAMATKPHQQTDRQQSMRTTEQGTANGAKHQTDAQVLSKHPPRQHFFPAYMLCVRFILHHSLYSTQHNNQCQSTPSAMQAHGRDLSKAVLPPPPVSTHKDHRGYQQQKRHMLGAAALPSCSPRWLQHKNTRRCSCHTDKLAVGYGPPNHTTQRHTPAHATSILSPPTLGCLLLAHRTCSACPPFPLSM